jgi:hypothetical protein
VKPAVIKRPVAAIAGERPSRHLSRRAPAGRRRRGGGARCRRRVSISAGIAAGIERVSRITNEQTAEQFAPPGIDTAAPRRARALASRVAHGFADRLRAKDARSRVLDGRAVTVPAERQIFVLTGGRPQRGTISEIAAPGVSSFGQTASVLDGAAGQALLHVQVRKGGGPLCPSTTRAAAKRDRRGWETRRTKEGGR